ncbi:MAG TPA: carboxypeptidase-like regulatory domain-containing protein [Terriglobales bacterium]
MKRISILFLFVFAILETRAYAQDSHPVVADQQQSRNLTGQVLTPSDQPLASAVVYLKNTKTLQVKSFITENDGGYRFHALAPNVDYEVYAEFQGKKSSTKTVSAFDSRANVTLNLHVDVSK